MVIERKPMTARSVVASTLLGVDPPRLPGRILVRSGELFGIAEGTTRVALSRMLAAGELRPDEDGYHLAGRLLDRQARQSASRRAATEPWDGTWELAVVRGGGARRAADRAALRHALADLRLGELREGVWARPANLPADRSPEARDTAGPQCVWARHAGLDPPPEPVELWALADWAADAQVLQDEVADLLPRLEAGDTTALGDGFVTSAAVLRLLQRDPLLPDPLLPAGWPGDAVRRAYDRYDAAFKAVWRDWFSRSRA
jgi:phenylacetic acid degradation operon negative regulatory protein